VDRESVLLICLCVLCLAPFMEVIAEVIGTLIAKWLIFLGYLVMLSPFMLMCYVIWKVLGLVV
jgi:hypothetical protein